MLMLSTMQWPATQRRDLSPAPGGLALLQDLLNTRQRKSPPEADLLAAVDDAQAWLDAALTSWAEETGRPVRTTRVSADDLPELRNLRDELIRVVRRLPQDPGGADLLVVSNLSGRLSADGRAVFEPTGSGWRLLASAIVIEIFVSQLDDHWKRLKTCRNERCPGSFYDRSPNNSGAWHDVKTCGNLANLHASRARRRNAG